MTSPEQDLELFNSIKKDITLERVNAAFRDAFKPGNRTIQLSGGAKATTAEVVKVWEDAASQPVKPLAEQLTVKFPYLRGRRLGADPLRQGLPHPGCGEGPESSD